MTDMILTNVNDISAFVNVIEHLEPENVLDVGMFLKRIGSISLMRVPDYIQIDGVDFFTEIHFPVWDNIYHDIIMYGEFFSENFAKTYDLIIALGMEQILNKVSIEILLGKVGISTRFFMMDCALEIWINFVSGIQIRDLTLEDKHYYLLDFGEK